MLRRIILLSAGLCLAPSLAHASDMSGLIYAFTLWIPALVMLVLTLLLLPLTLWSIRSEDREGLKRFLRGLCRFILWGGGLVLAVNLLLMATPLGWVSSRNFGDMAPIIGGGLAVFAFGLGSAFLSLRSLQDPAQRDPHALHLLLSLFLLIALVCVVAGYLADNVPY